MSKNFVTAETVGEFIDYIKQDNPDRAGILLGWIIEHREYHMMEFLAQLTQQEKQAWYYFLGQASKNTQH